jgi:nucleotidyltransferase/DNA polymerase involved in DNA repair
MERTIVHMDLDTFFVSVERLINPLLEGKPVIIGGTSDRGVVASCSYEARRFGVHSAMPMRMAKQLCSQAVYMRGDMELYTRYSRLVTDVIAESAPVYEKTSVDEHYLDLTGMDRFLVVTNGRTSCGNASSGIRDCLFRLVVGQQNRVEDCHRAGQTQRRAAGFAWTGEHFP